MAHFQDEWNSKRINEILSDNYPKDKEQLIKGFYNYLKEANFRLESQKTKLKHVQELFSQIGSRKVSTLTQEEINALCENARFREMKISLGYFFDWYKNNLSSKSFEEVRKSIRQRRIKAILNYSDFNDRQRKIMNEYYGALQNWNCGIESVRGYLQMAKLLLLKLNKDLKEVTKEDISNYLLYLNNNHKPKTIFERRMFLVNFLSWYLKVDKDKLDLVSDIVLKKPRDTKLPEEILTPDEIKKVVQVADNFRDKAIMILLYETASRKGEFLQLKIKHIELDKKEYGMVTIPMGKTDSRKVPIIYSVPYIQNLLNSHPNRDNPDAPLFITQGAWLGRALGEDGLKLLLKTLSQRAGIKKKVYPHLLRHSRLTELAKELTEQELKKFAGWTPNSNMASVYVHLSGSDVSNKILANAGLIDQANGIQSNKEILKSIKCPRCDKVNPPDNKYCSCGFVLDLKEVNKILSERDKSEKELASYFDPQAMQRLFKTVKLLEKQIKINQWDKS